MLTYKPKADPRGDYRREQNERVNATPSLAEKFPKLKSLTVTLEHFDKLGLRRESSLKLTPVLDKTKSELWVNCPCRECAGGDYDLSGELERAISAKRKMAVGELRCQGTVNDKVKRETGPCQHLLRFELRLTYS